MNTTSLETTTASSGNGDLHRATFTTSRLLDFFSEKELVLQTGHDREDWPDVLLKELVDNALDAAEDARVPPEITVSVEGDSLSVADNGPGLAPEIVTRILDFSTRTSSKDFYISPTRGTQGNALKTVLAIPFVLSDSQSGTVKIESRGVRHVLTVAVDRIRQEPKIEHRQEPSVVKNGAVVTVSACLEDGAQDERFLQRVRNYALLNPHAAFVSKDLREPATVNGDWQKWRPGDPTSPHWYSAEELRALIAAYLKAEQDGGPVRFVRDFVVEFRGLSGTAKQKRILGELGLAGTRLADLAKDGDVDREIVAQLHAAMQRESRPVKPEALGKIGEKHIRAKLKDMQCNEPSVRYQCLSGTDAEHRPYMAEIAFGVFEDRKRQRDLICGLNFSPTIGDPFRKLAGYQGLDGLLSDQFVSEDSPCCVVVHLTAPHLNYTGRGKSTLAL
jgi:DNA topoisomerase VI subunit B